MNRAMSAVPKSPHPKSLSQGERDFSSRLPLGEGPGVRVEGAESALSENLPFLTIPPPPRPGRIAWSLSPWLPE
jgi:hypothetical protein